MSTLNERGAEIFDQTPIDYPIHFDRPIPLHIRIRQQILAAQEEMRLQSEYDTPEDADDFDVEGDDDNWSSPYELDFDHISNSPVVQNLENQDSSEMKGVSSKESSKELSDGDTQPPKAEKQPVSTE